MKNKTIKIKLTFRITEIHTIEREVDRQEFNEQQERGDTTDWLENQFLDDPMCDSDRNTEYMELDSWVTVEKQPTTKPQNHESTT